MNNLSFPLSYELLSPDWIQKLSPYTHIYVGYSGGLDSTVLLSTLASYPELKQKLIALHVHHGLSPHAETWLLHCQAYCAALKIAFRAARVSVAQGGNLEERARIARYQAFDTQVQQGDALLLAHHQNDQAETLFLNLLRGTGLEGLCAMPEQRACGQGVLYRPLLRYPRHVLQDYARQVGLQWIEDEMNTACEWSRVFLRQKIMPLLQEKWPNVISSIATTAQHCQEVKQTLDLWIEQNGPDLTQRQLVLHEGLFIDTVQCTHVVRAWLKRHLSRSPSRACIEQILNSVILASPDAQPCVQVEDAMVRRYQNTLYLLLKEECPKNLIWDNFPQAIAWTADRMIVATPTLKGGVLIPFHRRVELKVRQGGEKLHWHGQTQQLKKLFQSWHIPPWQRSYWPLVYVDDQLLAVPDYAHSDLHLSDAPGERYTMTTYQK